MIEGRLLARNEIGDVWTIDRSEVIDRSYRFENGALVLVPDHCVVDGWPPGEPGKYTPILESAHDRGGWLHGLFDDGKLIGAAVLESRFIGRNRDLLQLRFMHLGMPYRNRGLGRRLFDLAKQEAARRGAGGLYISATPSERTIGFYLGLGCRVSDAPDPELLALEPDDIHMELLF